MAKVKILHVPYKGTAPAGIALLSGEVQLTFSSIPTVLPFVRNGRLRALGIGNAERIPSLAGISDDRGIRPARLRSLRMGRHDRTGEHASRRSSSG